MNDTTKRFPRTLVEAFSDADRAKWHEGWHRPQHAAWGSRLMAVAIGVSFAIVIVRWIDWSLT